MVEQARHIDPPVRLRTRRRRRPFDWLAAAPYIDALGVAASMFGGMTVTTKVLTPPAPDPAGADRADLDNVLPFWRRPGRIAALADARTEKDVRAG